MGSPDSARDIGSINQKTAGSIKNHEGAELYKKIKNYSHCHVSLTVLRKTGKVLFKIFWREHTCTVVLKYNHHKQ
jgi:hypothetical protein